MTLSPSCVIFSDAIHSKTAGIFKRVGQYSLDPLILLRPLFRLAL